MYTWYGHPVYRFRDDSTGRFVSQQQVLEWGKTSIEAGVETVKQLTGPLAEQTLALGDWQQQMRDLIKTTTIQQYILGKGTPDLTFVDYGSIGGMLADQYRYLDGFAEEIAAGNLSQGQIATRAAMYIRSANEAFQRAKARTRGIVLPAYPGDGKTRCRTNCGCDWDLVFDNDKNQWECTWMLGPHEHCEDCLANAQNWNPLIIKAE